MHLRFSTILLLAFAAIASAETVTPKTWLTTDAATITFPAFADSTNVDAFLDAVAIDNQTLRPRLNDELTLPGGIRLTWRESSPSWDVKEHQAEMGIAAVYVSSWKYQQAKLKIKASHPSVFYLDGEELGRMDKPDEKGWEKEITLPRGKHLLLVKCASLFADFHGVVFIRQPTIDIYSLEIETDSTAFGTVSLTTDPNYTLCEWENNTHFDDVTSPVLSRDGKYLAYLRSSYNGTDKKETWLEVRNEHNELIHSVRGAKGLGRLTFDGDDLVYCTSGEKGSDIWRLNMLTKLISRVASNIEGLVKLQIRGQIMFYTTDAEAKESELDYTLFDELEDRMDDWTRTRSLYALDITSGIASRISSVGDDFALDDFSVSPDGKNVFFTRRVPRIGRPYYDTEYWLYEMSAGAHKITSQLVPFETRPLSFTWLPNNKIAYVTSAFLSSDPANHNLTQTGLWILDLASGKSDCISRGQVFSVEEDEDAGVLRWNEQDKTLWLKVLRGSHVEIVSVNPFAAKPAFKPVPLTDRPFVREYDLSASGRCAFSASGPTTPTVLYSFNGTAQIVLDPNASLVNDIELAAFEPWNFKNKRGQTIEGWLYYPKDLPAMSRTWPLVVYYYGGVSPRDQRFWYTAHWWAANGYVVYVLNPVGAVGYGQDFADKHSNDWGTLASQDVIEGVTKVLKEKPYLDSKHVGAYGGSYGGFITMDLATKTDLFAALCSMSGISDITSYFGGGSWGFTYGDIALPRSFPWNRRDVFVDKSPIYHADKIRTPLLLTHGDADVNVPSNESDQMFVALKVLGKNVAYVKFTSEDHIFAKPENRAAEMEIMRDWFDKYLKDEPEAWQARWKK